MSDEQMSAPGAWTLADKCPHCGHRAAIHSGPCSTASEPGTCHQSEHCQCPGWHPMLAAQEWAEELAMEQERVERAFGRSLFDLHERDD